MAGMTRAVLSTPSAMTAPHPGLVALNRAQSDAATAAKQAELNAAEDRRRAQQREDELLARERQAHAQKMTARLSGTAPAPVAAAPAYASSQSYATAAAPAPAPAPIDLSMITALKQAATPPPVAPPSYAADKGVSDTAFARAKDKAGLLALRRTADARTSAAQRGITDSGIERRATESILDDTVNNLTGVAETQAAQEADRGYQTIDRNYQGELQQRGQDISLMPTLLSLLNAQRRY